MWKIRAKFYTSTKLLWVYITLRVESTRADSLFKTRPKMKIGY